MVQRHLSGFALLDDFGDYFLDHLRGGVHGLIGDAHASAGFRVQWAGITAAEIRAACAIHRVPRARQSDVAADVKFMGKGVAGERNRREDAA